MKKNLLSFIIVLAILVVPSLIFAQSVPTGGTQPGGAGGAGNLVPCDGPDCEVKDFFILVSNVVSYVIFIGIVSSSLIFAYAGFLYLSSRGNAEQVKRANKIFTHVGVGLFLAFIAFLVVEIIVSAIGLQDWVPIRLIP